MKRLALLGGTIWIALHSIALTLPEIFSDHCVFQHDTVVNIWGWSSDSVRVWGSWNTDTVVATPDASGRWNASLRTPPASFSTYEVHINDTVLIDVLVGDVWFCSGQSNMEMPLRGFWDCPVSGSADLISQRHPFVRVAMVQKTCDTIPQDRVQGSWQTSDPRHSASFSAVAYTFAQRLQSVLDIPVGVIVCAYGGSRVEGWLPKAELLKYKDVDLQKEVVVPSADSIQWDWMTPMVMYNAMLHPLVGYTIKGFLWYQGESNVGHADSYCGRLKTMVGLWRSYWHNPTLPFYVVEIAPYDYGTLCDGALLREAQFRATQELTNSGFISTNDLAKPYESYQIHPCMKQSLGDRVAYVVLNKSYGYSDLPVYGPTYRGVEFRADTAVVSFDHVADGMSPWKGLRGFELAGADKVFRPATAVLDRRTQQVLVTARAVRRPVAVRYCFHDFQIGNLKGTNGLPAVPFRSDKW